MSEVLQVEDARAANLGAQLSDNALQDAIDEEEAWLARRIGPLTGERIERFPLAYLEPLGSEVTLRRSTLAVVVEQDGVVLPGVELRSDGRRLAALPEGTRYVGVLAVTYEPDDLLEVRRALKVLVGLNLGATETGGLQSETMGSYAYSRGTGGSSPGAIRAGLVRGLVGKPQAGSTRLLSSVKHDLAGHLGR